jgi:hypothetical protein
MKKHKSEFVGRPANSKADPALQEKNKSDKSINKTHNMRKQLIPIAAGLMLLSGSAFAQLQDEKNVTITMDLQPILQLNMNTSDQISFVFDDIADYYGGITKYGATILTVSSSVNWDLYAVGTSTNGLNWDNQMQYYTGVDPNAVSVLPLSALELHQSFANANAFGATGFPDYSLPFAPANALAPGQNSIYQSNSPYTPPTVADKYIQGEAGTAALQQAPGGSYLTVGSAGPNIYYYSIDYRILPGLPAVFPAAGTNAGASTALVAPQFARPGIYTMDVKYVLLEDQ